ncbi:hypothetical protein ACQYAD_00705 [Neobacillus sp. SM06]|uniref:hypothetical protein n=1 Tax=Neobacillus sp. SM06 TaxID=3422492 RepID=UPI003D264FD1
MIKRRRSLLYLFFTFIGLIGFQNPVFANHAGAIEISKNTYSVFLYIMIALGILIILVVVRIQKLTKQVKDLLVKGQSAEDLRYQRKFLSVASIMLIIGFLSMGAIYFFLRSAAGYH